MIFGRAVAIGIAVGFAGAAAAQVETIDPNNADARRAPSTSVTPASPLAPDARSVTDVPAAPPPVAPAGPTTSDEVPSAVSSTTAPAEPKREEPPSASPPPLPPAAGAEYRPSVEPDPTAAAAHAAAAGTYQQNDVLAAAEGVFGRGAEGLAKLIQRIFWREGQPNGYIVGREAGGAIVAGVRYGSGTLFHKIEGERRVFWQGPSVGIDLGAHGAKTFVLVYNLYDTQDLFRRYPAAEGNVYVVGGFTASVLRWKDVVLVPIRLGVGWRLGANLGYMHFTEKKRLSPF